VPASVSAQATWTPKGMTMETEKVAFSAQEQRAAQLYWIAKGDYWRKVAAQRRSESEEARLLWVRAMEESSRCYLRAAGQLELPIEHGPLPPVW
jgi:hypothetical protein